MWYVDFIWEVLSGILFNFTFAFTVFPWVISHRIWFFAISEILIHKINKKIRTISKLLSM